MTYQKSTGKLPRVFNHFLGTGGNDAPWMTTMDPHVAETDYYVTPPVGEVWEVRKLLCSYEAENLMEVEQFGVDFALNGGISIVVSRAGVEQVLNYGLPIQSNGDFAVCGFNVTWEEHPIFKFPENERVGAILRFEQMFGAPLVLRYGDKLIVRYLADSDTSALYEGYWTASGISHHYAT